MGNFFSKELIVSSDLGILDEKDVYDAVIKWVKHDVRERAIHLAGKDFRKDFLSIDFILKIYYKKLNYH
jgi:hypothetical protein